MSATALVGLAPTVLGPLTTVFTPPPACTVAVGQADGGLLGLDLGGLDLGASAGGPNVAFLGQTCSAGQPGYAASCWPPTSSGAPAPPGTIGGWGLYSPGIECPAGYATACSATAGGSSGWPLQFQLTAGETAVGCCPSGYGCANVGGQTCAMVATSTVVQTATCHGDKIGALQTASVTALSLYAPMIQINFQSSDLPAAADSAAGVAAAPAAGTLTTRTTTTIMAASPAPTASSSPSQNSSQAPSSSSSSSSSSSPPSSSLNSTQQTSSPTSSTSEQIQAAAAAATSTTSALPTSTTAPSSDLQSQTSTSNSTAATSSNSGSGGSGFPRMAAVGIGVGGGVAALVISGSALTVVLRRRRRRREEESLDRLYGLGKLDSLTDSSRSDEFPGFYRGQVPTRGAAGMGSMRQINF